MLWMKLTARPAVATAPSQTVSPLAAGCGQGRLVAEVGEIGPGESRRQVGDRRGVDARREAEIQKEFGFTKEEVAERIKAWRRGGRAA